MPAFFRVLAAGLLLAVTAAVPMRGDSRSAFGLGVLRRDGILVPFCSYNGRGWTADWTPEAVLPISLADIPKRWWGAPGPTAPWTAWLLDGTTRPLALKRPEHFRAFCGASLGVQTDYPPGAFNPRDPSVVKDGLAIAGDAKLLPVVQISVMSPDARRLVEAIADDFDREERLAADRFNAWVHPFGDAARKAFPIELEAFYRAHDSTPSGEWATNYIEAVRRFPARPGDDDCGLITFVRGWVLERPGQKPVVDIGARITYCDRADVSFMLPFGRLLIDREPYWVYQISSWRDEIYGVSRVRPDAVRPVMAVSGGSCPKEAPRPKEGPRAGRGRSGGG
jgi:hypothetical protein